MDAPLCVVSGYGLQILVLKQVNRGAEAIASDFPTHRLSEGDGKLCHMLCEGQQAQRESLAGKPKKKMQERTPWEGAVLRWQQLGRCGVDAVCSTSASQQLSHCFNCGTGKGSHLTCL